MQAPITNSAMPEVFTVGDLAAAYTAHAEGYYVKNGRPTGHIYMVRRAMGFLTEELNSYPAASFGPRALRAIHQRMIEAKLSRRYVCDISQTIKRAFRWAVSYELIAVATYQALATVDGPRKGRTAAREPGPVLPVADSIVNATLPYLPAIVADMVRLHRLLGCRPGELCRMRPADIDRSGKVWRYIPQEHKSEHRDRSRTIYIGPKAQALLNPYLVRPSEAFCFSPTESEAKRRAQQRQQRKTPVQPSQRNRRKMAPTWRPAGRYTTNSYRRAILRAAEQAEQAARKVALVAGAKLTEGVRLIPPWHPNQLRHALATAVRHRFGLEAAQVILGHASADVTQVYAERDAQLAERIVRRIG